MPLSPWAILNQPRVPLGPASPQFGPQLYLQILYLPVSLQPTTEIAWWPHKLPLACL